ncbi:MAG: V-type ATP synthase subunit E family protein [Sulfolobales archaeon]
MSEIYRIYGDPQKIVEEISSEILERLEKMFEELRNNVKRDLEDLINKKASELRSRIDEGIKKYRGTIESSRSKLEVELKKIAEQRREIWINKVVDDVRNRFIKELLDNRELYKKFLRRSLEAVLALEGEVYIETNDSSLSLVKEVIEEIGAGDRVRSVSGGAKISGGFIALSRDRSIRYNYTLDHVIETSLYELKVRISRILFG